MIYKQKYVHVLSWDLIISSSSFGTDSYCVTQLILSCPWCFSQLHHPPQQVLVELYFSVLAAKSVRERGREREEGGLDTQSYSIGRPCFS